MSYTNKAFLWDFDALRSFYENYVVKWLNSAMSWTAAQKKQARANLGFESDGEFNEVDSNAFYVTDSAGNVIAKIDADGVHSVDFKYGQSSTSVATAIQSANSAVAAEANLREAGDTGNAALVTAEETRAKAEEAKKLDAIISDNAFYFTDANGNIIAKIDADGIHSVDFKIGSNNESIITYVNTLFEPLRHSDILYGKTLCCCGDSITYGADMDTAGIVQDSSIDVYQSDSSGVFTKVNSNFRKSYGYQIAERHNMTFYNAGVSGSTIQGLSEKNGFSLADGRYTKLPDNLDIITIFFGWNDNAYGTLGTISDNTNETYYGAYNVVLPYLIDKYPYAKIIIIVPYGCTQGHRDAVRLLGNKWGVAVFDMYQGGTPLYYGKESYVGVDPGVKSANIAKFQVNNGAHPNYRGHQAIGDMLEQFLLSGFAYCPRE